MNTKTQAEVTGGGWSVNNKLDSKINHFRCENQINTYPIFLPPPPNDKINAQWKMQNQTEDIKGKNIIKLFLFYFFFLQNHLVVFLIKDYWGFLLFLLPPTIHISLSK